MAKQKDDAREARLKAALKANMARRKAQTKARGTTPNTSGRKAASESKTDG
jgi:hypothetical protein